MKSRMPVESRPSSLLTNEENELVFKLLGPRCQSLATAVVQLFATEGPGHNQWCKRDTGILCLVKDNSKRSYYFRIYCMQRKSMIWEHEVYSEIVYRSPRPFLHTFEAEECITAFNFASEDEALNLKNNLIEKIEQKKHKKEERRQRSIQSAARASQVSSRGSYNQNSTATHNVRHNPIPIKNNSVPAPTNPHLQNGTVITPPPHKLISPIVPVILPAGGKKSKDRRKLTKADIGMPQDFKHVSHVGWDANKGFDVENLPEEDMKDFFDKAGVSETQLQDKNTRNFIYDFIKTHGGVDAVKEALVEEEIETNKDPLIKTINQTGKAQLPPPVPVRNLGMPPIVPPVKEVRQTTVPSARAPPPPPPPPPQRQAPPPMQPTGNAAPPPPPPPPAPPILPPSAAPAPQPVVPDMHAALFDSIRGGKQLKHVDVEKKPVVDDKRGDLLSEIRQGIELRSVTLKTTEADRKSLSQTGLAGALARALEERSKVMHSDSSDSDEDDTTSDGDEWED